MNTVIKSKNIKPAATKKPSPKTPVRKPAAIKDGRLFELEVTIIDGLVTEAFVKKNPKVSRTIEMRGDQTLEKLHDAIFKAFDRFDPHLYEFQIGGREPMDPKAKRYVLQGLFKQQGWFGPEEGAEDLCQTRIGDLDLKKGRVFYYWFDFGDDWWHKIKVVSISEKVEGKGYPKITARTGESPPQYVDWDEIEN